MKTFAALYVVSLPKAHSFKKHWVTYKASGIRLSSFKAKNFTFWTVHLKGCYTTYLLLVFRK